MSKGRNGDGTDSKRPPEAWWGLRDGTFLLLPREVHDKLADGTTAYENCFGVTFDGPIIPLDANINCKHICSKGESRLHQSEKKG